MAAIVDNDGPGVIDVEKLKMVLEPEKHFSNLRVQEGKAPMLQLNVQER